jgi:hypothetical protein
MEKFRIFSICILLLAGSCETWDYYPLDEFNLDGTGHSVKVYVDGGITTQNAFHRIYLYKPSDFLTGNNTESIISAKVYVTQKKDTMLFVPVLKIWDSYLEDSVELENPYYQAKEKFGAVVGNVYTLHIEHEGGHYYGSDSVAEAGDFNFQDIPLPSIRYDCGEIINGKRADYCFELKKHHFGFSVSSRWLWIGKEIFNDTVDLLNVNLYLHEAYSHQFTDAQGLFSNIEYYSGFSSEYTRKDDTLIVVRVSLSDGYVKHLNQKFMETDWKEGVFASQPGNLSTNMSTGAMGYFFASDLYRKEITVEELLKLDMH